MTYNKEELFYQEIKKIQPKILYFCKSRIFCQSEAEDVAQNVLIILLNKKSEFNPNLNLSGWAFRIAHYQIKLYLTYKKRSKIVYSDQNYDNLSDNSDREKDYQKRIQSLAMEKCIQKLSSSLKPIAELRFNKNFSIKDISKKVNRPKGAVTATLFRAKDFIRKNIDEECLKVEIELENS
jgi:RNA polymerase sigma factor (sigma-70 family)|tara:strand:+ start:1819 stop:2358 length:540 start_codon:yes stop_codon:yes gene_type:complete